MCLLVLNWSGQACLLTCGHAQCSAVTGLQTLISWRAPSRRPWCQRSLFLWGQGSRCWLLAVFRTGRQEYWHLGEPATPIPATRFANTHCLCMLQVRMAVVLASTTVGLAGFGSLAAWLGGAHKMQAAARVVLGGWAAMGLTFGIGTLFEAA